MIKFDPSKLSVQIFQLKAVSTALGGSIAVLDTKQTTKNKEVMKKIVVPLAVARAFIMKHKKITKYLKAVPTAVVRYEDRVVALERHPLGNVGQARYESVDGSMKEWEPSCLSNIRRIITPATRTYNNWYFDGRYMYRFGSCTVEQAVHRGELLSQNGQFRKVTVDAIDLQVLGEDVGSTKLDTHDRDCIAFVTSRNDFATSPPIWKQLGEVGARLLQQQDKNQRYTTTLDDDEDGAGQYNSNTGNTFNFNEVDRHLRVNLNFALAAGREIGKTFGYTMIEPLNLPRLMIEMRTVNLPNIPTEVKATYDTGMKFTHAIAWLLGLSRHANTLEAQIMLRALIKYLTKKGIFRANVFEPGMIFANQGSTVEDVQLKSLDKLLARPKQTQMSLDRIVEEARKTQERYKEIVDRRNNTRLINAG